MKKAYNKPEIIFEDFSLSTNIAGDCDVIDGVNAAYGSCGIELPGIGIVFVTGVCERKENDPDNLVYVTVTGSDGSYSPNIGPYDSICYHVPQQNNNLFNS